MVYLATLPTADAAQDLVHELTQGRITELTGLAEHIPGTRLYLDDVHHELWRITPEGSRWAIETATPADCLEHIQKHAASTWTADRDARSDYHRILATLLPGGTSPLLAAS
jgi:hypothetical protein